MVIDLIALTLEGDTVVRLKNMILLFASGFLPVLNHLRLPIQRLFDIFIHRKVYVLCPSVQMRVTCDIREIKTIVFEHRLFLLLTFVELEVEDGIIDFWFLLLF